LRLQIGDQPRQLAHLLVLEIRLLGQIGHERRDGAPEGLADEVGHEVPQHIRLGPPRAIEVHAALPATDQVALDPQTLHDR
jgi:hypothetical protein